MANLFEQIGGEAAVDAAVELFYQKVLADDRINSFFENIDMARQKRMQKEFLSFAFGGPNQYSGRGLGIAHKRLVENGLNDSHYDAVIENLGASLQELHVPDDLIAQAAGIAESVRAPILGKE